MKKRILYIVTQSAWGGAQKYIYDLAVNIPKDTYEVTVASGRSDSAELLNKLVSERITCHQLNYLQREINPLVDIRAIIEIYTLIKKIKPDIVHLNSTKVSIVGSIAATMAHVPKILYTAHGWVFNEPNSRLKNLIYLLSEKITRGLKDDIICVSEYDKKVALQHAIRPKNRLTTIHNGIDFKNLLFYDKDTARDLLSQKIGVELSSHQHIIGTVGNLYKTKGHSVLIDAAKQFPNSTILILGEGPERNNLEKQIKKNDLKKRVLLPGSVKNGYQYLKAFDIFVLPSVKEGFPYIVLETLASGVPMVVTNVGGISEILPKEKLIVPNDVRALSKALLNPTVGSLFNREKISIETMVNKTLALYL